MNYSSTMDGLGQGDNGFTAVNISNGASELSRGFTGAQQTRALHGAVNIGGVDYTLATTNDAAGNLTTAWYNNTTTGLGAIAQTIDIAPMMAELGISTADQITGGAMYLAEGGNPNNLEHYITMWNSEDKIAQFNSVSGIVNSFDTGANHLQDIMVQGDDLYAVNAGTSSIGSVERYDFSNQHFSVPEPSSGALLGLGALAALSYRKRD